MKIYSNVCDKYRKLKNPIISYLKKIIYFKKILGLFIVSSKCGHEYKEIFQEGESFEILKILGSISDTEEYKKYIIMTEENISQQFRLKNID